MSDPRGAFLTFKPPGPVAARFLRDTTSKVRSLRGPVGGGKTVACIFDALANASRMPVCRDGQIHFKLAVIGTTYGQLEKNLYETWKFWLPTDGRDQEGNYWTEAEFKGGGGRYATHQIRWRVPRAGFPKGVIVNFQAIFSAIGEQSVEQFMRGFEPTAFWLFEMDLLPESVLPNALFRLGRFPRRADIADGSEYRAYIVGDLNSPDVDSWYYNLFEDNKPKGFEQYVQPSGLSPQAENLANLPVTYYSEKIEFMKGKPNLIKRFVLNEYAPSSDGQPVYPEYADERHLSPVDLVPLKGTSLLLGVDAGLRAPAAVLVEQTSQGQWRVLGETVPGRVGTKSFAMLVRKMVGDVAPGRDIECGWCDPFGFSGSDAEDGQLAWAEQLQRELGIPILPAPSNEIDLRLDAVRDELNASIDGNTPALVVSRRCRVLRKGFASHYRYARRQQAGQQTLAPKPHKDEFADVHDALQYALLGKKGRYGAIRGATSRNPRGAAPAAPRTMRQNVNLFGG